VSLDKNDNDLRLFLNYLLAAIQTMFPDAGRETLAMANALQLPPLSAVTGTLINELDRIEQPFILSLDDCHHIQDESVLELLAELLKNPIQLMHLVMVSRRDPPLPIYRLRAQGRLTEIRTQGLRFSVAETATFLNEALGTQVDPTTSKVVGEKTEGWVTGLQLAALSMQQRGDVDPRLLEPQADAQYVMEYLFAEVFSHQPPEIRQYLLVTAILDRFCGPLCEALCAPESEPLPCKIGEREFIAWLKKENAFLISLDSEDHWFRYHHLFQKLLLDQLNRHHSAEEIKVLHARASAWFAENDLIEEALQHALAGGNWTAAIHLIARHGHRLMNGEEWLRLENWLRMLPADMVDQDPELLLFEAWIRQNETNGMSVPTIGTYLEKIERLLAKPKEKTSTSAAQLKGHLDALNGFRSWLSGDGDSALRLLQSACENIPMHHKRARLSAYLYQTGAYQMIGDLETGLSTYHTEIQKNIDSSSGYHAMYLASLCFFYWIDADLIAFRRTAEAARKMATELQIGAAIGHSLYFLGIAEYQLNNLQNAEENLNTMVKDFYFYRPVNFVQSSFALGLVYHAWGKTDKARKVCEHTVKYAIDSNNQEILRGARAFEAELALCEGRLTEASHWARRFNAKPFLPPYWFYMPQLTLIKILMAQDTTDSRQQAADLLDQLNEYLASIHNNNFRIHVLALQALHHDTQGEKSAAYEKLTAALGLAEPGGFIRLFVDLGSQMADLLKRLIKQNIAVGYVGRILSAFSEDEHGMPPRHPLSPSPRLPTSQPLIEPLTNRELDILELVAQRLHNKEIAEQLYISPETVKRHLQNVYHKLQVRGRREAVARAADLGLLDRG
jgi:LuxR family maltose regulon positive regulatory protein